MTPQPPDYAVLDWKLIYSAIKDVLLFAALAYTWWSNREKVNTKRFGRLESEVRDRVTNAALDVLERDRDLRCDEHRGRTSSIEKELQGLAGEIKHLPSQTDIGRVHARMDNVASEIDQAVGELKATTRQVNLVLESLLQRDK